jgi:dihydroneopterin aldolase
MIIKIKNLRLKTKIGVYDFEKNLNREIIINAEIEIKSDKATNSDKLSDTVDYAEITTEIKNLVKENQFKLIEKLAGEIVKKIMENKRIKRCKVEIDKTKAIKEVESFSVTVEKFRK